LDEGIDNTLVSVDPRSCDWSRDNTVSMASHHPLSQAATEVFDGAGDTPRMWVLTRSALSAGLGDHAEIFLV
jgi:hypothetical protein